MNHQGYLIQICYSGCKESSYNGSSYVVSSFGEPDYGCPQSMITLKIPSLISSNGTSVSQSDGSSLRSISLKFQEVNGRKLFSIIGIVGGKLVALSPSVSERRLVFKNGFFVLTEKQESNDLVSSELFNYNDQIPGESSSDFYYLTGNNTFTGCNKNNGKIKLLKLLS